ncbi:hypothetical protein AGR5A_Lc100012 [Agrobacterium genomosp. 5 str. CFBP 6626]|nr:hypothetical protein AGR5A_Lc100012 [Agrobacterium genomosp. 5 str. CFBP 6626]
MQPACWLRAAAGSLPETISVEILPWLKGRGFHLAGRCSLRSCALPGREVIFTRRLYGVTYSDRRNT